MNGYNNLVICCDGTGNEISENISNVLKLYRCQSWPRKFEQGDKWSFCLTAGTLWPANQERP
jgi:hypothetical protein